MKSYSENVITKEDIEKLQKDVQFNNGLIMDQIENVKNKHNKLATLSFINLIVSLGIILFLIVI